MEENMTSIKVRTSGIAERYQQRHSVTTEGYQQRANYSARKKKDGGG